MKGRFYGFVGTKLNIAIGVVAGLDFLYVPSLSSTAGENVSY